MAICYYVKSPPTSALPPRSGNRVYSFVFMGLGVFILVMVFGSMGVYQWRSRQRFQKKTPLLSPVSRSYVLGDSGNTLNPMDYTRPQQWFSNAPALPLVESKITHYNLSIPVLKINRAVVEVGGEDLGKSMVHYPGTTLPGQRGTAVVFCHSVLPHFFNPKNYKTICSTLPTLDLGDEIMVYFDGVEYRYQVVKMFEVQPTDVSILDQDLSGEYLVMVTCVPPGTYLRRLVVKSRLI